MWVVLSIFTKSGVLYPRCELVSDFFKDPLRYCLCLVASAGEAPEFTDGTFSPSGPAGPGCWWEFHPQFRCVDNSASVAVIDFPLRFAVILKVGVSLLLIQSIIADFIECNTDLYKYLQKKVVGTRINDLVGRGVPVQRQGIK